MQKKLCYILVISFFILTISHLQCYAKTKKIALVIGNNAYENIQPLKNPNRDARLIAKRLNKLNFEVDLRIDTSQREIIKAITDFKNKISQGADVTLFYYAGHGVQLSGQNYLIPVDINIDHPDQIEAKAANVNLVFSALSNKSLNIIILDACRNNPFIDIFSNNSRSLQAKENDRAISINKKTRSGLSRISAPINTLISFSTSPGNVALDGEGSNSYFTKALVEAWSKEGLDAEQVFKQVRKVVYEKTKGKQVPWENSSLVENFFFNPRKQVFQIF
jgi:uncharacterized caspase-like protein